MANDHIEERQEKDLIKNKFIVHIMRDTKLMKTFFKFKNRIEHPRASMNMFIVGALLIILPIYNKGIAMPGVVICFIMGPLIILMALFRHYLSIYLMTGSPGFVVNEEINYLFGTRKIRAEKKENLEDIGYYNSVTHLWEDESHFYVGVGDKEVLVLPKVNFKEGNPDEFKDFILEKSGAKFRWTPARFGNIVNDKILKFQHKLTQIRMDDNK